MRTYVVQDGDSPASIAAKDSMAGCPRCSCELPRANPHKRAVRYPNGFVTFESIVAGETINLPDEWFHPARDRLPPTYYKILPHPDGRTRGSLDGTLAGSPELDTAVAKVAELAAMGDRAFSQAVAEAGAKVDAAAQSKSVQDATRWAWQRNRDLAAAIASGDRAGITQARLDIQNALATALGNAHVAHAAGPAQPSDSPTVSPTTAPAALLAAAKAAVAAIATDPNYCTSVSHPGTPVNAAVHRFKLAWNASQATKVPIATSAYEPDTVVALAQVLGSAPSACGQDRRPVTPPKPPPPLPAQKAEKVAVADRSRATSSGWSTGAVVATVALGAIALGGAAHFIASRASKGATRHATS